MSRVRGWFCEHRDLVAIKEKAAHWQMYCAANRRCEIAPDRCHEVWVSEAAAAAAPQDGTFAMLVPLSALLGAVQGGEDVEADRG